MACPRRVTSDKPHCAMQRCAMQEFAHAFIGSSFNTRTTPKKLRSECESTRNYDFRKRVLANIVTQQMPVPLACGKRVKRRNDRRGIYQHKLR